MVIKSGAACPFSPGLYDAVALLRALPEREVLLGVLLGLLRRWTGCDAVGVRLARDGDYPYFTSEGFSEEFLLSGSSLCVEPSSDAAAGAIGRVGVGCMCGAVIAGRIDPTLPFFTAQGSFFTGSISRLQAEIPLQGRLFRCKTAGYETILLTPLRFGARTLGLLQINDHRRDHLDGAAVAGVEELAQGVATLLARQEMQEALAEAQARYQAMFFTNIAMKLLIDPETGHIVDANPAACMFYGYSPEAMRQLSIWDINIRQPADVLAEMTAARDQGRGLFHFTHRLAGGELRDVEVYSGPLLFDGRPLLFSIIHDVTDRVRAEKARDRAEQILRHDLRSPLAGIVGLSEQLAERLEQLDVCPEAQEMVEVIHDAAERLACLINRTLDLQKIEQGCYVLHPGPVALGPLLRHILHEAACLAQVRQVALQLSGLEGSGENGLVVLGEADLLSILFSNLVTNALEAAPAGSEVCIHLAEKGGVALVGLHNQGVVPEDIRPRFFTKYATSGKTKGTGLGAYTARALARLHGGDIDWESDVVTGTLLTVHLPLAAMSQLV